jgi:diketogulonate reductase-like aldo/keto reductase
LEAGRDGQTQTMSLQANTSSVPPVPLNDGNRIPQLGFGVFQVPPEVTAEVVLHALRTGYRSIDTAAAYSNEAEVGKAIKSSGLAREEVFVTSKLWNNDQGHDQALRAFQASVERLGFDYLDLYLIHWPAPARGLYVETWQALVELDSSAARSIGVSNFEIEHLERIIDATGVIPPINQVELHPRFQQSALRRFHAEHGIVTEAWSPLGRGRILDDPTLVEIAHAVGRTPAQVVLRWHIQLGNVVIPRSVKPERIEENFRIFDFELSDDAMRAIEGLDADERIGPDPMTFNG